MATSSSQVKDFEEDLAGLAETVRRDMSALRATFPDPAKAAADAKPVTNRGERVTAIFDLVRRFRTTLSQLEIEAADVPAAAQTELRARIKGYKSTLASLDKEKDLLKKQSAEADSEDLTRNAVSSNAKAAANAANLAGSPGDDPETLRRKRELAANTAKAKEGHGVLTQAEQVLNVIHETADDTLNQLDEQGRKIRNIAGTTSEMDQELTVVARTLRKMQKELLKNKLMLAGVIVILVIAIFGLLYYKFGGAGGTSAGVVSTTTDDTLPPTPPPGVLLSTLAPYSIPTLPPTPS